MFKNKKIQYSVIAVLLISAFFIWECVFSCADNKFLEVNFLDVGQGDAIFIETPKGKQVLIDGGPDKIVLEKLSREMSFFDRDIDLVVLTHPDADHITGLIEILDFYNIGHILTSGFMADFFVYKKWQDLIREKEIPLTVAQSGQKVFLEENIVLEIIWPDQLMSDSFLKKANNASVVGRLVYGDAEILLSGDIEKKIEGTLVSRDIGLESDVVKIPHHGSKTSASYNFLKAVNPKIAIVSVGVDNRYNHPSKEVLERLESVFLYRTDKRGSIKILTDGSLLKIKTEK